MKVHLLRVKAKKGIIFDTSFPSVSQISLLVSPGCGQLIVLAGLLVRSLFVCADGVR